MSDTVIDLTGLPPVENRCNLTRWNIWEKARKGQLQVDPTLTFKPQRTIANENLIITQVKNLEKIPPCSIVTRLRAELTSNPDKVVIWQDYGVFDREALHQLCTIHANKNIAKYVNEEYQWIRLLQNEDNNEISKYMYEIWHTPGRHTDKESLLCNRLLTDGVIQDVLNVCNVQSTQFHKKSQFYVLNNETQGINFKIDTQFVHFIINVTKRYEDILVTPADETGSHWTYLCIDRESNSAVYNDSLGWRLPVNLLEKLNTLASKLCNLKDLSIEMLHVPNRESSYQHVCSTLCKKYAPFQTCGNICGVATLSLCLLSFQPQLWKLVTGQVVQIPEDDRVLEVIRHPTDHAALLRMQMMTCISSGSIRIDMLKHQERQPQNTKVKPHTHHQQSKPKEIVYVDLKDYIQAAIKRRTNKKDIVARKKTKKMVNQKNAQTKEDNIFNNCSMRTENDKNSSTTSTFEQNQKQSKGGKIPTITTKAEGPPIINSKVENHPLEIKTKEENIFNNCSVLTENDNNSPTTSKFGQNQKQSKEGKIPTNTAKAEGPPIINSKVEHNPLELTILKKLIKQKKKREQSKKIKEKLKSPTTIKSLFEKMEVKRKSCVTEEIPVISAEETQAMSRETKYPDYLYTAGLKFKGLSKLFYKKIGVQIGKNSARDVARTENPVKANEGKIIGMQRVQTETNSLEESISVLIDHNEQHTTHTEAILKTAEFINRNGPVLKTQSVSEFYLNLKGSTKRIMSSELIEKLGRCINITQIYINGTGYIVDGKHQNLTNIIHEMETLSKSQEKQLFNEKLHTKIKQTYSSALESLKDPYDRQIFKGMMATLSTPKFMAKLEGKQNKISYRNSKDILNFHLKNYNNIELTSLIVRNDMTNQQQRLFSKRLVSRRKLKEMKSVFEGRGRVLKSDQFPELAAVLEYSFGEFDILQRGGGGLESHPRLTDGILYRSCDNNMIMRRAREIIQAVAPENFQISLSTCYNYTQNYKAGSHQAKQHHDGKNINANISLNAPPRTGVVQFVVNLHWTTANVCLQLDDANENQNETFVDSKDSKSIVCANVAPVQKPGRTWSRREYLDHDWDQSRTYAVTPMTHLILQTEKDIEIKTDSSTLKIKRSGRAVTILNLSYFEPETAFKNLNEIFLMLVNPETSEFFRNPVTGEMKKKIVFVVDNGASTAPNNTIVRMCLARLFKFLDLDSICQVSYAEYHSKRNPVERVHAEENRALSRHGPFVVNTTLIKPGSNTHKHEMEIMLDEVSTCLRTGQFNGNNLITMRGVKENTCIFNDEIELKKFLALSEDQKDVNENTYSVEQIPTAKELNLVWKIDESFERLYNDDYNLISNRTSISDKYTAKLFKNKIDHRHVQPIPDYTKYSETEELHYCDLPTTNQIINLSENSALCSDPGIFMPSRILEICFKLFDKPPAYIQVLLSLLSWVPVEEVDRYFKLKKEEEKELVNNDKDTVTWRSSDLYHNCKKQLQAQCKILKINADGTKVQLIKRIAEHQQIANPESIHTGDINEVPNSISGLASMSISSIRTILAHHSVKVVGSKEELVLRLFMLKHQPELIFRKEKDGLLDLIRLSESVIKLQRQQKLMSLDHERMFPTNKRTTTRQQVLNEPIAPPTVPLPAGIIPSTLVNVFQPLKDYLKPSEMAENTKTSISFSHLKTVGSTIKVKWLREEVSGSTWKPGWYSASVVDYDQETDEMAVEYFDEKGSIYKMNFQDSVSKGLIEPSKPLLAKIEMYEKMLTVGQHVEIKWNKDDLKGTNWTQGWYEAEVTGVDKDEDTIHVRYKKEPTCIYSVEVSPYLEKCLLRLKK